MTKNKASVCALGIADVHWGEKAPIARSVEEDWLKVQAYYMAVLRDIQKAHKNVPILIAGDLFNQWNSSPHLINHVLRWLEGMKIYAIPGNHDMPQHNYQELERSAYWTLIQARAIHNLAPGETYTIDSTLEVSPFPTGFPVQPAPRDNGLPLRIALIHDYIWTDKTGHPQASPEQKMNVWARKVRGYDIAIFGDNHQPFNAVCTSGCKIANCGTLLRRHSDEKKVKPSVVLIYSDGSIGREYLPTHQDKFLELDQEISGLEKELEVDLAEFASELSQLTSEKLDYAKTVLKWVKKEGVPDRVKEIILRCLQGKK